MPPPKLSAEKELNASEQTILMALRAQEDGTATIQEIADFCETTYNTAWRHIKTLKANGWVELAPKKSSFGKTAHYQVARITNDGIDFVVTPDRDMDPVKMSWNVFLQYLAGNPQLPDLAEKWPTIFATVISLTACAIAEGQNPGTIEEHKLLEIRGELRRYKEALEEELNLASQLLRDQRLWDPEALYKNAVKLTDKPLTVGEYYAYINKIKARISGKEIEEDD